MCVCVHREKKGKKGEKRVCVLLFVGRVCLLVTEEEVYARRRVVPRWRPGFPFL